MSDAIAAAREQLQQSIITYHGRQIGTVASMNHLASEEDMGTPVRQELNYDQCFIRDFIPSGLAFLMQGEREIVRNFLEVTLGLQVDRGNDLGYDSSLPLFSEVRQSSQKAHEQREGIYPFANGIEPGEGLMPASFKVLQTPNGDEIERDFGQQAIGRVVPVDSGLWWIFLLNAYERECDRAGVPEEKIAERPAFQRGIYLILDLCLTKRFDMTPMMLVPEASFAIDRRMGVYGYPLEIQVLFYQALLASRSLLQPKWAAELEVDPVGRTRKLLQFVREHYWLGRLKLMQIYDYNTEEFSETALNKFNIYVDTVPDWVASWLLTSGQQRSGYLVGNVSVGRIDFRFFTQGNLLAILFELVDANHGHQILNTIENQWDVLVGEMPLKICYPAVEGRDWYLVTGCDPKNVPWSYHNGGNWPTIIWILAAGACKVGRLDLAQRAVEMLEAKLPEDDWPEYYDGFRGDRIGRRARLYQTWSIAGYLVAKLLLDSPEHLALIEP